MINTFKNLEEVCVLQNKAIYQVAQENAAQEQDITVSQVRDFARKSLEAMNEAIETGLNSTELSMSGMCGADADRIQKSFVKRHSVFGDLFEMIVSSAIATGEENIRMGKIVACPTAGSCGILPSVIISFAKKYKIDDEELLNALITAGVVGQIISAKVSLAGAVAGCQAECGAAAAMSAAAATQLLGGNTEQILNSIALTMKNILGLTCDPVAGLVEVPCVKRNAFMAIQSITGAELAMCGVKSQIPPDEVVQAMEETGLLMSPMLKESSQAGLATTPTGLRVKKQIFGE